MNQAIAFKLADMKMQIDAARLLVWRACWMAATGKQFTAGEGSMSKLYAGEVAVQGDRGSDPDPRRRRLREGTPRRAVAPRLEDLHDLRRHVARSSASSWPAASPACTFPDLRRVRIYSGAPSRISAIVRWGASRCVCRDRARGNLRRPQTRGPPRDVPVGCGRSRPWKGKSMHRFGRSAGGLSTAALLFGILATATSVGTAADGQRRDRQPDFCNRPVAVAGRRGEGMRCERRGRAGYPRLTPRTTCSQVPSSASAAAACCGDRWEREVAAARRRARSSTAAGRTRLQQRATALPGVTSTSQ